MLLAARSGSPSSQERRAWGFLCSTKGDGQAVAFAHVRNTGLQQIDELQRTCSAVLSGTPSPGMVVLLLDEPISDRILLSQPPSTNCRWVLATRGDGDQLRFRGWGWEIDEETRAILDVGRAKRILDETRIIIEQRLDHPAELFLLPNRIDIQDADLDTVRAAARAIAERDSRWRALEVDGELVICRQKLPEVSLGRWAQAMAWLRSLRSKKHPDHSKLEDSRIHLAVRASRYENEIDTLGREEESVFENARKTKSGTEKRASARRIADLRRRSKKTLQLLSVVRSQREIIESHLHHLELIQTGTATALPSTEEITERAVHVEQILEDLGEVAGVAQASSETVAEILPAETEIDAIMQEFDESPVETLPRQAEEAGNEAAIPTDIQSKRRIPPEEA